MKQKVLLTSFILFASIALSLFAANSSSEAIYIGNQETSMTIKKEYTKENYPIKAHHEKLRMDCASCHGDGPESEYTELKTKDCLTCHKDYKTLAKRTEFLGYDDNIHASPHYPEMDCNLCHSSHRKAQNYCVMCHSQDSMKKLIVP